MMNEQMIRKNNMKIYPIYQMFSWDLLFYYAIIFLFLTQVKGFSASTVLILDSFFAVFRIIFQIFCINIVDLLGKQKSLLIGNIFATISVLFLILGNTFGIIVFSFLIQAIGFNIKGLCEPTILSDSIPKSSFSANIYSKIYGKGSSYYFIFDAISSIVTGYLYILNPYIPLIMCFICCFISTIISLLFEDISSYENVEKVNHSDLIAYYKDTFVVIKQIFKSNRLKSLLIFSLFYWAFFSVFTTLRSSILIDLYIPEQYFGIIVAVSQVISSFSSQKNSFFQNKFKNRLLTWISLPLVVSLALTGLVVICNINYILSIITVLLTILLFGIMKGPYFSLLQRYFNSFSNPNVNSKIFALKSMAENFGRVVLSLFSSFLLNITTTSYVFVIIRLYVFYNFCIYFGKYENKSWIKT